MSPGKKILSLLQKHLGGWPRTPDARFARAPSFRAAAPKPKPGSATVALLCVDSELTGSSVEVGVVLPPVQWVRSARTLLASMRRDIWLALLSFRLAKIVESVADPPFAAAGCERESFEGCAMLELFADLRSEDQWEGALSTILDEVRRSRLNP